MLKIQIIKNIEHVTLTSLVVLVLIYFITDIRANRPLIIASVLSETLHWCWSQHTNFVRDIVQLLYNYIHNTSHLPAKCN